MLFLNHKTFFRENKVFFYIFYGGYIFEGHIPFVHKNSLPSTIKPYKYFTPMVNTH